MAGANVFAYDGTGYKPTNRDLTAAISSRTASGYTAVTYCYQLSKPAAVTISTQIWQGFPPIPSQVTFSQGYTGAAAPDNSNRTTISWTCDSSTLLARFELYQKIGTGSFTAVSTAISSAARSFTVDNHAAGTLYTYYVRAVGISGLTRSGTENSFTLTAPVLTGVSISVPTTTSSSLTWRATFPSATFQKIVWYRWNGSSWVLNTSAALSAGATTADHTWSSLSERTTYYAGFYLFNFNNHSTGFTYVNGLTTNAPPNAPTLSSITASSIATPAKGSGGGWATTGEVRKYVSVAYTLASDTDYKNHEVYLYSGATTPTTYVSSILYTTGTGGTATFTVNAGTKYWALVRQRDNNDGETDNATGWQSVTTPAVLSYTNADAYDTATGTTYSESSFTIGDYTDISYLTNSVTLTSDYTGTILYGGSTALTYDRNMSNYVAWRVLNNTYGSGSVGRIRFEMSDLRASFLKYYVNGSTLEFNQKKHNVAVQMRSGTAGSWQGSIGQDASVTGNTDPIVYITPNNNSFTQAMSWGNIYGLGFPSRSSDAAGAVAFGAAGNGGGAYFAMRFGVRNPTTASPFWVHLGEYERINIGYTTESSVTTYTNTPAVTRYY
jgi:hypothetical protein